MKTKQVIVWTLIAIGMFSLLYFAGKGASNLQNEAENQSTNTKVNSESQLTASETFYDFGTISMKDGKVSKVFKISNSSEGDINLMSVSTSCMCTVAYVAGQDGSKKGPFGMPGHGVVPRVNEIIKAGESRDIEVIYDPNAHGPAGVGIVDRFVYLEDENGNKLQFEIKANVTP
ncbi:MAG: hypothetical protein UU13_C0006G0009 [Candidatus Nomurabacteria bacterium GW2011_GWB1_40_7]|uniref:PF07610 family protein n=1 Tax=Candidatus Nomurabacteria bacterium GW2011_GWB1_40_7 TaxID=1618744 RepID=A0A0G0W555_9BACT|nr:MAG: hypothetical protein UU13_C0006G0009 [Candidatus Nomurabacteria bacterium GW2011_GWB1_40_7]